MPKYVIVFCGTPDAAVPALRGLLDDPSFDVRLVVTQPDQPTGRKQTMTTPPVKACAAERGVPVFQPERLNASLDEAARMTGVRPDFLVVVAYGQILSDAVLAWPAIAPINVHFSLLPRWRGASPVESAVLAGDRETGVTIQVMQRELDSGPLLAVSKIMIGERETARELRARLALSGATLLRDTLAHPLHPEPQPASGITLCTKLGRADGRSDPRTMTAAHIDRMVRALVPWPGVTCTVDGHELKILESSLVETPGSIPLACAQDSTLFLVRVQVPGGKPLAAADWERGRHHR